MAASAVILGLTAVNAVVTDDNARKARNQAKDQAAAEREQLAQLAAKPEALIPSPDDASVKDARRRSITAQLRRRGRAGTILTGDSAGSDSLGA